MAHTVVLILTLDLFGGREVAYKVALVLTLDLFGGTEVAYTVVPLILTLDLFGGWERGGIHSGPNSNFNSEVEVEHAVLIGTIRFIWWAIGGIHSNTNLSNSNFYSEGGAGTRISYCNIRFIRKGQIWSTAVPDQT